MKQPQEPRHRLTPGEGAGSYSVRNLPEAQARGRREPETSPGWYTWPLTPGPGV
jgi:hypothetical protein